jgi:hypothetical protein
MQLKKVPGEGMNRAEMEPSERDRAHPAPPYTAGHSGSGAHLTAAASCTGHSADAAPWRPGHLHLPGSNPALLLGSRSSAFGR